MDSVSERLVPPPPTPAFNPSRQYALIQRMDTTGPQWPETPDLLRRRI